MKFKGLDINIKFWIVLIAKEKKKVLLGRGIPEVYLHTLLFIKLVVGTHLSVKEKKKTSYTEQVS